MSSSKRPPGANANSPTQRKRDHERAQESGMAELRVAAEKRRLKTESLRKLRLEREAALPVKKKAAPRKPDKDAPNLAITQRRTKS